MFYKNCWLISLERTGESNIIVGLLRHETYLLNSLIKHTCSGLEKLIMNTEHKSEKIFTDEGSS